jgi:hypothetical protein
MNLLSHTKNPNDEETKPGTGKKIAFVHIMTRKKK